MSKKIVLKTSDGESFEVDEAIIHQSQTIAHLIEDDCITNVTSNTKILDTSSRDAISCLPDELLGYILSLVPTKEAASTTFLSERWRNVFRLVQSLEFDASVAYPLSSQRVREHVFERFVDGTLALQCDSPVKKFSLRCDISNEEMACRWICNVLERGVEEVELILKLPVKLPSRLCFWPCLELFRSKTLVKLTLGTQFYVGKLTQDMFLLPVLKTLIIDLVWFESGDLEDYILPGCPVLEELSVKHDWSTRDLKIISSPTLKRLSLHRYGSSSSVLFSSYMSFDTPKLIYIDYSDCVMSNYPNCDFGSLVEAKLNLMIVLRIDATRRMDVTSLVMAISNVQILHLSPNSVEFICSCCNGLPMFNNLNKLSFGSIDEKGWQLLPNLLKQSPKLETLIITDLRGYTCDVSLPPNQVKVLHVLGYRGTYEELKHLENFLEKVEFLEMVEVKVRYSDMILQTKRDLITLPIVSSSNFHIQVSKEKSTM